MVTGNMRIIEYGRGTAKFGNSSPKSQCSTNFSGLENIAAVEAVLKQWVLRIIPSRRIII